MNDLITFRRNTLISMGAGLEEVEELLEYNRNNFIMPADARLEFPLPDEPFVKAWRRYARNVERSGSLACLSKYLVQLRFPIQAGMSSNPEYLACTRAGAKPGAAAGNGFPWHDAARCQLIIHPTSAGHIPCLIAETREDFVSLVRALARRNEPALIPDSMGACTVAGYNNWDRIAMLRRQSGCTDETWPAEFERIKAHKELYRDCFIILSSGPYSGVKAADLALDESQWRRISLAIRREHECMHYFSHRVLSSMKNNLLDELIADYFGISAAAGNFRADWLLRFFGLEAFPAYRESGRLEYYRQEPRISDGAFSVLRRLVRAAISNLQQFDREYVPAGRHLDQLPAIFMALASLTVEQMAAENGKQILAARLRKFSRKFAGTATPGHAPERRLGSAQRTARKQRDGLCLAQKTVEEV